MEEITFSGMMTGILYIIGLMVIMFVLLGIALTILEITTIARWKLNYNILKRGRTPENPIKLSIIYQADFFRVEKMLSNGIVKIIGIELNLGFKECTNSLYVRFPKNTIPKIKPGIMYDFRMRPV